MRVFAIGPVIRHAEMEDYASFCKAWDVVVRTEVLPCLADDKPNLLVFPENATLAGEDSVTYTWPNPVTERPEEKKTLIRKVGNYLVAVGYYQEPVTE